MQQQKNVTRPWLMLAPLALLLAGCASALPSSPSVEPAIPPLPAEARQPAIPSKCLPTCSSALTVERESWLNMLTQPGSQDKHASGPTTR